MNKKCYYKIEISSKTSFNEDFFSFINGFSPLGIWQKNEKNIDVYFAEDPEDIVKEIKKANLFLKITYGKYVNKNWVVEYQKKLKPIKIGEKFVIIHFLEKEKIRDILFKGREVIKIVPGVAFGTGEHFTTNSCIQILETVNPFPESVLDIGTGSGILAVVSSKLGGKRIYALDNDFDACRTAKETFDINKTKIHVACSTAKAFKNKFDLIMANILFETIIEISDKICDLCTDTGQILLSGIRSEKEASIVKLFEGKGFLLHRSLKDENWSTLLLSRKTKR